MLIIARSGCIQVVSDVQCLCVTMCVCGALGLRFGVARWVKVLVCQCCEDLQLSLFACAHEMFLLDSLAYACMLLGSIFSWPQPVRVIFVSCCMYAICFLLVEFRCVGVSCGSCMVGC